MESNLSFSNHSGKFFLHMILFIYSFFPPYLNEMYIPTVISTTAIFIRVCTLIWKRNICRTTGTPNVFSSVYTGIVGYVFRLDIVYCSRFTRDRFQQIHLRKSGYTANMIHIFCGRWTKFSYMRWLESLRTSAEIASNSCVNIWVVVHSLSHSPRGRLMTSLTERWWLAIFNSFVEGRGSVQQNCMFTQNKTTRTILRFFVLKNLVGYQSTLTVMTSEC